MSEPLEATFFAFRKREQNGVLLRAAIGFGVGLVLLFLVLGLAFWQVLSPAFAWYAEMLASGDPSGAQVGPPPASLLWIFPAQIIFLFALFVLVAAFEAACYRWMIHGESGGGLLGLTLGADTWRVYGSYWVWFLLAIGLYIACAVVFVGAIAGVAGSGADPGIGVLIGLVIGIVTLAALIYVGVRLAPASATSVGRRRFSFFSVWSVSRGRFWELFGAFLILIVLNVVVSSVLSVVAFSVVFAGAFANLDPNLMADPESFLAAYMQSLAQVFATPGSIAMFVGYYIVSGAIGIVFYVLFYGVNARAVQAALAEGKITEESAG